MKLVNAILVMILLGAVVSESALARGRGGHSGGRHFSGHHSSGQHFSGQHFSGHHFSGHHFRGSSVRFGVIVGAPAFWYYPPPYYYYSPYYPPYYPPVVTVPSSPPVYIEQGEAQSASKQADGDWYYCADAQAYYPYVKECPQGWQRVAPQPPGP